MAQARWRQRWVEWRVRAGDGRPLRPYRWWQQLTRSLFELRLEGAAGAVVYAVDVRHSGDASDGVVRARLHRDGLQAAVSRMPARFPVEGGAIEVAATQFGLRRCHYVDHAGRERQLSPHPRSGAGRRARLARERPALSRAMGVLSVAVLLVGATLLGLELAQRITELPPVVAQLGWSFASPIQLGVWPTVAVGLATALASTERALRLRYHWLLDPAGNG